VIYTNLSNMREDLARGLKTGSTSSLEKTLKDLEAYIAYVARYIRDLLQIINEL